MGQPSSKLRRSTTADVRDHLGWACEQLAQWEDGASLVKELLATDISEASEALAVVSTPSTAAAEAAFQHKLSNAGAGTGGVGGGSPKAQQPQQPATTPSSPSKYVEFDSSSIRLLLHSIDEVLRRGESHDFFKGIPQEKLENMMATRASSFVLPPHAPEGPALESSSASFSHAAIASVLRRAEERAHKEQLTQTGGGDESLTSARHKRSQAELYEAPTPLTSPVPPEERESERVHAQQRVEQEPTGAWQSRSPVPISAQTPQTPASTSAAAAESERIQPSLAHEQRSDVPFEAQGGAPMEEQKEAISSKHEISMNSVENQRKNVVCKYLYVLHLFRMLLSSAEFMTKQLSRVTQLKKLIRPGSKHAEHMSPLQKQRSETVYRSSYTRLERALIAFDRTRVALGWLLRNYELSCATFKVNSVLAHLKHKHAQMSALPAGDKRELATASRENQLSEVAMLLHWFDRRHVQLLLESQANERESLNVGLIFMDRDLTGTIGPDEVPTLPVKLFNLLDVRKKNEVTTSDLQASLHKLSSNIDQQKQRVIRLEEDNARLSRGSDVELAIRERNEMEIDQIKPVIAEYQHALSSIYAVFHGSLRQHLFAPPKDARPIADVRPSRVSMQLLNELLEEVEEEASTHTLEQELNLGMHALKLKLATGVTEGAEAAEGGAARQPERAGRFQTSWQTKAVAEPAAPMKHEEKKAVEHVPSKDASALEVPVTKAGEMQGQQAELPVHDVAAGGAPAVKTTAETKEPSLGQRIKDAVTPASSSSEEPDISAIKGAPVEPAQAKPSTIEELGSKVKSVLGMGE